MTNKQFPYLSKFIVIFYAFFSIISFSGYFIIKYREISILTIVLISIFVITFSLGAYIGNCFPIINIKCKFINPDKLIQFILVLSFLSTLAGWFSMIKHYGSLAYILANSFTIRLETIGDGIQIIPTIFTYCSSLNVIVIPIALVCYRITKEKKYILYSVFSFVIVALCDLQTFGRIGILFSIFSIVSYLIIFRIKLPLKKTIIWGSVIFLIFMLPRYIRGGNSIEGIGNRYKPYLVFDYPAVTEPFITLYAYYFSGYYAFDYLLDKEIDYSYGERNLAAVINLLNRIMPIKESRTSIIADNAYVPFDTNIYTIIGELYLDGGLFAIIIGSVLYGLFFGWLFKYKGLYATALKIILLCWIFESPIYNVFSFGSFFLAFVIIIILTILFDDRHIGNNSKLQLR